MPIKIIGITKSNNPTQSRSPWRIAYEKDGKQYARYETSQAKAIQWAESKKPNIILITD